jgi:uncharacterized protein with PQ loop repeat
MIVRLLGAFWACEQGARVTKTKLAAVRIVNSFFAVISCSFSLSFFIAYSICENKEMDPLGNGLNQDKTPEIFAHFWIEHRGRRMG